MEVQSELMKVFAFWSAVLVLKMMAMVPLTGRHRFAKKASTLHAHKITIDMMRRYKRRICRFYLSAAVELKGVGSSGSGLMHRCDLRLFSYISNSRGFAVEFVEGIR